MTTQTITDAMDPERARALHATLGRDGPAPGAGDPLPPFWHHVYFWTAAPASALGRDGHPKTGGFIPDTGLPRRMWAGGRLEFHHAVRLGSVARLESEVTNVVHKTGRSGPLAFVTVENRVVAGDRLCVREEKDLVYRQDPDPSAPVPSPPQAPTDEAGSEPLAFTPTLLFRYSALTFNGHRIHYDRDYARDVEGYAGLVVHGPLLAQIMVHKAEALLGGLRRFAFRAASPLMDFEPAQLCWKPGDDGLHLWIRGPDGRLCMSATASA